MLFTAQEAKASGAVGSSSAQTLHLSAPSFYRPIFLDCPTGLSSAATYSAPVCLAGRETANGWGGE